MSWLDKLVRTYDLNAGAKGLVPLFHTEFNAQIIVTLNENGDFADARIISEKKEQSTIIPCTEASSARTSGRVAHPLFDSLRYVAGDLSEDRYLGLLSEKERDEKIRIFQECFELYRNQLNAWCSSPYADQYVSVVQNYILRKQLCKDLIEKGILPTDQQGAIFLEKPKKSGDHELDESENRAAEAPIYSAVTGDLSKAVVLFEIGRKNQPTVRLWESPAVQESWLKYYTSSIPDGKQGFCQILGREGVLTELHPKRICNPGDNAKLISGNDSQNFTYRGRFETPLEIETCK